MAYSVVGFISIFIHLIVNIDIFLHIKKKRFPGAGYYLLFLLGVIIYHITDTIWGVLYENKLRIAVIADTAVYFIAMAVSILFFGLFVYHYLGTNKKTKPVLIAGLIVFLIQIGFVITNFFYPVLFSVSEECVYTTEPARYGMLIIQELMYLVISVFVFVTAKGQTGSLKRRYLTIGLFGVFMFIFITLQAIFYLQPLYSLGFVLGVTALHSFVIEDEMANQRDQLEEAKNEILIDTLTGAMSKHAYVDRETEIDNLINEGQMGSFAVVVFDLNDLKLVNDTYGHEAGDTYIVDGVKIISEIFKGVPVYRVGGDEFVVILEGENYDNRKALLKEFNNLMDENLKNNSRVVIAAGISDYRVNKDTTIIQVFTRADSEMYKRKHLLKGEEL